MKKLSKTTLRNKADKLLQEYIREKHKGELCWICGERSIVCGHHFIYKSQSLATRYYLPNLIPICRDCHLYAHRWQNLFNAKLSQKLGKEWLDDIEAIRGEGVKFTLEWIQTQYNILRELKEEK